MQDLTSVGAVEGLALDWLGIMYGPRKLRGVFHDWAKAPKNWSITLDWKL